MEAWQLMAGLTGLLLVYAVLATVFGYGLTPVEFGSAVVFGAIGLYVGHVLSKRLTPEE
jgi:hypothetical protein